MSNDNIDKTIKLIAKEIYTTTFNQELKLKDTLNKGIFFMPELAVVFECGMEIMKKKDEIFSHMHRLPEMKREESVKDGSGPSDLIFDFDDMKIIIEFKIKSTSYAYNKDIEKLKSFDDYNIKLFCALTDVFSKDFNTDGRIQMANIDNVEIVLDSKENFFPTYYTNYRSPVVCTVGVWKVN